MTSTLVIWSILLLKSLALGFPTTELVPNLFHTGPEPTEAVWNRLQEHEVKTLISVDGIRPDLKTAREKGFTYIHLPIGYDGITRERVEQLASALKYAEGPIYLHCHHGKHRGPAAAVVAALANGLITQETALAYLKERGTSEDYSGLWEAVSTTQPLSHIPKLELPAHMPVEDLTETMSQLDRVWENVDLIRRNDWSVPTTHPDLVLNNELTLLYEYLFESQRLHKTPDLSADEKSKLKKSYQASLDAIQTFRTRAQAAQPVFEELEQAFQNTQSSCKSCHQQFRN